MKESKKERTYQEVTESPEVGGQLLGADLLQHLKEVGGGGRRGKEVGG